MKDITHLLDCGINEFRMTDNWLVILNKNRDYMAGLLI